MNKKMQTFVYGNFMKPIKKINHCEKKLELDEVIQWLFDDGFLSEQTLQKCRQLASLKKNKGKHPLKIISEFYVPNPNKPHKTLSLEELTQWLAHKVKQPYYYIDPLKIDVAAVTSVFTEAYAAHLNILPVSLDADTITIASAEPFIRSWEQDLDKMQDRQLKRVIANPDEIRRYLNEFYEFSTSLTGANKRSLQYTGSTLQNLEQLVELGKEDEVDANNMHVVNLVNWLLQYAFDQRASDIHIEPRREHGNVRFRIDGVMHRVYQMPMAIMNAVMSRIKVLGRMNIAEKRLPQDGRIKTCSSHGREIELRLSTMPTAFGEKIVMRIFDPEVLLRNYAKLGFTVREQSVWQDMIKQAHGIILVTGPTGSGKTTTLYSTLKQLATPEVNVCTVEDPIELIEPNFNQMQVQQNINLTFASGIRTLMRQDPDIIMVGEIRDHETAEMAIQASLTGHLVLSTLHTNNASTAITRLLEIGVPSYLIQQTLLGVMAQRLVRLLCPHCKKIDQIKTSEWNALVEPFKINRPKSLYRAIGCNECRNTGYLGRMGIYEIFKNTPPIQELIIENCDALKIQKQAIKDGMLPLRLSGAEKVAAGLTTIEEVLRVAPRSMQT